MNEDGDMRDDLKLGENCTCSSADAVRELITQAESTGERVVVCTLYWVVDICDGVFDTVLKEKFDIC